MISVVIATRNDQRRLGRTLTALVPSAVDGLVRQVIVADLGSTDATLEIADDAGAVVTKGSLADACAAAKEDWLLILDPGAKLADGWERAAHDHIVGVARPGVIRLGHRRGLLGMMSPAPAVGLLIRKAEVAGEGGLGDMVRAARDAVGLKGGVSYTS
jgi:glycosyltransferase involved in cell wall biosynthesis